jgi:hypothetical protein
VGVWGTEAIAGGVKVQSRAEPKRTEPKSDEPKNDEPKNVEPRTVDLKRKGVQNSKRVNLEHVNIKLSTSAVLRVIIAGFPSTYLISRSRSGETRYSAG